MALLPLGKRRLTVPLLSQTVPVQRKQLRLTPPWQKQTLRLQKLRAMPQLLQARVLL
jgi:hypothetical protein